MFDLERLLGNSPSNNESSSTLTSRQMKRASTGIGQEAAIAGMKVEGVYRVSRYAAEKVVEFDRYRRQAATNEVLDIMLARLEEGLVIKSVGIINDLYRWQA